MLFGDVGVPVRDLLISDDGLIDGLHAGPRSASFEGAPLKLSEVPLSLPNLRCFERWAFRTTGPSLQQRRSSFQPYVFYSSNGWSHPLCSVRTSPSGVTVRIRRNGGSSIPSSSWRRGCG